RSPARSCRRPPPPPARGRKRRRGRRCRTGGSPPPGGNEDELRLRDPRPRVPPSLDDVAPDRVRQPVRPRATLSGMSDVPPATDDRAEQVRKLLHEAAE